MARNILARIDKNLFLKINYASPTLIDNRPIPLKTSFCRSVLTELRFSTGLVSVSNFKLHNSIGGNTPRPCHIHKIQFSSSMADAGEEFRHLDYKQLMDFRTKEKHILIDVREKSELDETGVIPGAFHIPVGEIDTALAMSDDKFKTTYNFNKPSQDDQIVFSCRSGKRSLMALEKAISKGFVKARHYKGGWLDWERNSTSQ